jgi:hypothetical protein
MTLRKSNFDASRVRQLQATMCLSGAESRASGRAGSHYGRGLNIPRHLTVFNCPSSRVRICEGQRRGFKVLAHRFDDDTTMTRRKAARKFGK